jgi:hypothetical protein
MYWAVNFLVSMDGLAPSLALGISNEKIFSGLYAWCVLLFPYMLAVQCVGMFYTMRIRISE